MEARQFYDSGVFECIEGGHEISNIIHFIEQEFAKMNGHDICKSLNGEMCIGLEHDVLDDYKGCIVAQYLGGTVWACTLAQCFGYRCRTCNN